MLKFIETYAYPGAYIYFGITMSQLGLVPNKPDWAGYVCYVLGSTAIGYAIKLIKEIK